jgi:hypothetical protein
MKMDNSIEKLQRALAAAERMTDEEYLALHEEAKKYTGPDIVFTDFNLEPETHLILTTSASTVSRWIEPADSIRVSGDAAYGVDSEMPLVA